MSAMKHLAYRLGALLVGGVVVGAQPRTITIRVGAALDGRGHVIRMPVRIESKDHVRARVRLSGLCPLFLEARVKVGDVKVPRLFDHVHVGWVHRIGERR